MYNTPYICRGVTNLTSKYSPQGSAQLICFKFVAEVLRANELPSRESLCVCFQPTERDTTSFLALSARSNAKFFQACASPDTYKARIGAVLRASLK